MGIETLNEDLELNIPMFDDDMDIIAKLDDEPNAVGGLTAAELKAEFDRPGKTIQEYLNKTLIPSLIGTVAEESVRAQNEYIRVTNENQRVANENGRVEEEERRNTAELERIENEDSRGDNETKRVQAETARAAAEAQRKAAEQAREDKTSGIVAQATEQANEAKNQAERAEGQANKAGDEADRAAEQANKAKNEADRAKEQATLAGQVKSMQAEAATLSAGSKATAKVEEENGDLVLRVGIPVGRDGKDGADGKTAYEYAQGGGFTGTEEEFAELLANGNGGGADWDQNDPEGAGYVKGRTHYREPKYKDTFPETSVAFDSSAALVELGSGKALVDGETYFVIWNGETYQVKASVFAESGEVYVGDWDTKEYPFFIENSGPTHLYVSKATSSAETITMKIQQLDGWDYHPFQADYLPLGVPYSEHVDEVVLPECSYDSDGVGYVYGDHAWSLTEGWVYDVMWNGTLYRCPAVAEGTTVKLKQAYVEGTELLTAAPFQQFYPPPAGPTAVDGKMVCGVLVTPKQKAGTVSVVGYTKMQKVDPASLPSQPNVFTVDFVLEYDFDLDDFILIPQPDHQTAHERCAAAMEAGRLIVARILGGNGGCYQLSYRPTGTRSWYFTRVDMANPSAPVLEVLHWDTEKTNQTSSVTKVPVQPQITGEKNQFVVIGEDGKPVAKAVEVSGGGASKASELENDVPFVSATAQTLAEAQQQQAQENIGLGGLVVSEGGDTLTWDGNTEGKTPFQGCYKVSDVIFTSADLIAGSTIAITAGAEVRVFGISGMQVMQSSDVCMVMEGGTFYIMSIGPEMATGASVEEGTYFGLFDIDIGVGYISSLTIPGYTGFAKKQVNPKYLPEFSWENLKDKPFGDILVEIIPETEMTGVEDSGMYAANLNPSIITGEHEKLVVTFDGVEYSCNAQASPTGFVYGNGALFGLEGNGEPFAIVVMVGMAVLMVMPNGEPHMVKISTTTTRRIDSKYIPGTNILYSDGVYAYSSNELVDGKPNASKKITQIELKRMVLSGVGTCVCDFSGTFYAIPFSYSFDGGYGSIILTNSAGNGGTAIISVIHTAEYKS